ncbi:type III secretion system export apparatus subunit SctT [Pantoea sp. SORGH_AS_0659]|uniref:type III secretion system export apparatus subunit SctT n=1 Tax=Pantoea sp. SORGH_AS_0659 TaxID=3062597 RepID=UPI00285BB203|nr:type III secretion system export apparatus subunit SctT [Pantoea sp. SORGH_AS_0659]MDR6352527.1 type III secretion protein SpaR/YscT/HrcT [Pantoea sp. SORGH_AS_0659]
MTVLSLDIYNWMMGTLLASVRILPSFLMLPFLSNSVVTGVFKFPLVFLMAIALGPLEGQNAIAVLSISTMAGLLCKEAVIGGVIALFLCFPFWVMHATGSLIDNQRGATISSTLSPLSGLDTSELANFFQMTAVALILQAGGMNIFIAMLHQSYQLFTPLSFSLPDLTEVMFLLGRLTAESFRFASPVVTIFLVTELLLGLLARYTPQLNPFSIALTIKSLVGFLVLLVYFSPILPDEVLKLQLPVLHGL